MTPQKQCQVMMCDVMSLCTCKFCSKTNQRVLKWRTQQLDNAGMSVQIKCEVDVEQKPFTCQYCAEAFAVEADYQLHERSHIDEKSFADVGISDDGPVRNEEKLPRKYGKMYCKTRGTVQAHERKHEHEHNDEPKRKVDQKTSASNVPCEPIAGSRPNKCQFCPMTFTRSYSCLIHERRIHTGIKPFTCKYCRKSFTTKQECNFHERIHTGEKPFTCGFCTKSFSQQSSCVRHERLHTGEKPYECHVCALRFSNPRQLISHEREHTGEKFSCTFEGTRKGDLYTCDKCFKNFLCESHLDAHECIHKRESQKSQSDSQPVTLEKLNEADSFDFKAEMIDEIKQENAIDVHDDFYENYVKPKIEPNS